MLYLCICSPYATVMLFVGYNELCHSFQSRLWVTVLSEFLLWHDATLTLLFCDKSPAFVQVVKSCIELETIIFILNHLTRSFFSPFKFARKAVWLWANQFGVLVFHVKWLKYLILDDVSCFVCGYIIITQRFFFFFFYWWLKFDYVKLLCGPIILQSQVYRATACNAIVIF